MSNIILDLREKKLINPPPWLAHNTHYLGIMGSVAYGVSSDTSDMDVYGFAIPPKEMVFKHLTGYIPGFGQEPPGFDQFQQHRVKDKVHGVPDELTYEKICQELKKRGEI